MVSMLVKIAAFALAMVSATVHAQPVGEYFRPSGDQVSGVRGARTPFLRSPCPALNTLANHGYIPRNGRGLTPQMLRNAVMSVYNVDFFLVQLQTSGLSFSLTLADLSRHNFIEHDASLVHADMFYNQDPSAVDGGLANDLLARGNNGRLSIQEVGLAFRARLVWCQQKRTGCDFGRNQRDITFREGATFLQVFGGKNGASISVDHAFSFLVDERFPSDWVRARSTVTLSELENISRQIQRVAGV